MKNKDIEKIRKLSDLSHKEWNKVCTKYCRREEDGFDFEAGDRDLKDMKIILDEENIKCWLGFGTLLGAIRDNDWIPYDSDVDLYVYNEEIVPKYNAIKEKFMNVGFIFRDAEKKRGTKINLFRYDKYNKAQKNSIEGLFLDLSYKKNKYRLSNKFKHPRKFFEKNKTIKFKGIEFRVPSPPEEYLAFLYKDWKHPINPKSLATPEKWRAKGMFQKKRKDK